MVPRARRDRSIRDARRVAGTSSQRTRIAGVTWRGTVTISAARFSMRTVLSSIAVVVVVLIASVTGGGVVAPLAAREVPRARAQAPDAGDIAEGMRLYLQKGDCQACHGWADDGRQRGSPKPDGAKLAVTRVKRG